MSLARIRWISGPVLRARAEGPFRLREAVEVGPRRLLGEVIRLEGDELVAQVYEDTTGLKPGISVTGTGELLRVRLGPHLLGRMFDGLLRPLGGADSPHVEAGAGETEAIRFRVEPRVTPGQSLAAGSAFAEAVSAGGR
jgi:V/A-type H+-transporting ATPase subunit A